MLEIIRLVRMTLDVLVNLAQPLKVLLMPPVLTVAMLLFLYAGWHVRDEGSVSAGLRVAFVDTTAYRLQHLRDVQAAILQAEMRRTAATDALIDQLLTALLQRAANAARVRLAVVHNGITGLTGMALLRFDITNAVAGPGRVAGPMVVNESLSEWNDFLPQLLAGQCQMAPVSAESNVLRRARLEGLGAGAYMACPVVDIQGRMLGAVLVTWDSHDAPPDGEELRRLTEYAAGICIQVAAALDLGHRLSPRAAGGDR